MVLYHVCSFAYEKVKMILWSIRAFWYKGLSKIKEQKASSKIMPLSLKNSSPVLVSVYQFAGTWHLSDNYWYNPENKFTIPFG